MRKSISLNQAPNEATQIQPQTERQITNTISTKRVACAVLIWILTAAVHAQTITQLFSFSCPAQQFTTCPDGYSPNALIQASDGNFYGAAQLTTSGFSESHGGTIFKITPSGKFTRLFTFSADASGNYVNGDNPASSLLEGNDGFLYGTSFEGGANNGGALFRISKSGTGFKVLHSFCSSINCADGKVPLSLALGHDGNLYGVTEFGGTTVVPGGAGTIFKVTPTGFSTLFVFDGTAVQGGSPLGLTQGADGNFYGVGGANVFRFTLAGQLSILHVLPKMNGFLPTSANNRLVQATNGKLYGGLSTYSLSQLQFYEINPSGSGFLTFPSLGDGLGSNGVPGLIQASDGNLWDTVPNLNSIIAVSPTTGSIIKRFEFSGTNGGFPDASVVQGADGKLYGTAAQGGTVAASLQASGTVWTLDAGLAPPAAAVAAFMPTSGIAGSTVKIRGNHFIGTTAVTFNGVNATFKVLNTNFISATVPAGATSGPIAVSNPGGTTVSAGPFTVK